MNPKIEAYLYFLNRSHNLNMNTFKNEHELTQWLIKAIKNCNLSFVKEIFSGAMIPKKPYEDMLVKYFGAHAPMIMAKPDIVLIIDDYRKVIDEWLLVAIELKYFKRSKDGRWRGAYRNIGQALRYHIYGFDSAVLWHVFEENISSDFARTYSNVISEIIERLKLPIIYFSTKIINETQVYFHVFKPLELGGLSDVRYIIRWMINCCRDIRNSLLPYDKEIVERRRVLKGVLRVP